MKGKKWRDVRNALVMVIVMVAMMSSATFAWFTLTSSPTVTGLQMTAASSNGLLVSKTGGTGTYYNAIALELSNVNDDDSNLNTPLKLTPVTTKESANGFYEPQYSGGYVTGVKATPLTSDALKSKVAVFHYYIKADEPASVGIITGNPAQTNESGVDNNHAATAAGTFVRGNDKAVADAAIATRIGVIVLDKGSALQMSDFDKMKIIEPNVDGITITGLNTSAALQQYTNVKKTEDITIDTSGNIIKDGSNTYQATAAVNTSSELFKIEAGKLEKEIYMFVWLEGTDAQCVDGIKTDVIESQIQFTIVEPTTP